MRDTHFGGQTNRGRPLWLKLEIEIRELCAVWQGVGLTTFL